MPSELNNKVTAQAVITPPTFLNAGYRLTIAKRFLWSFYMTLKKRHKIVPEDASQNYHCTLLLVEPTSQWQLLSSNVGRAGAQVAEVRPQRRRKVACNLQT